MYGVVMQLDPPTNAAIGPSPAQRRAATSKIPTTWHTTGSSALGSQVFIVEAP